MLRARELAVASIAVAGFLYAGAAVAAEKKVIGLAWNAKENAIVLAWERYMQQEAEIQGPEAGFDLEFVINVADADPTRQAANIEDLINQDVDVIIARGEDSAAIGASIRAAARAGIPFITFDKTSSTSQPDAHVGGDTYNQAITTSEAFVKMIEDKGIQAKCIELQGALKDNNAVYRHDAWHLVTDKSDSVETLQTVPTEWNPEIFRSGTVNGFTAHPEANCMFLASDFPISAVRAALESLDRWAPVGEPNHVYIATQDLFPEAVTLMEQGYLDVGTTYDAFEQAQEAIRVAIVLMNGGDPECSDRGCLKSGRVVTPENIGQIENHWAKE
ncbi:sugar ABC transporter substrate-binding protein [Hoeflea prorocentri]|uniref:Sugar ABC transporter substrate-binding protein n=1 Tax=Hoeflea prorocentri TaxID=1922333 RepID=A0A9X3ULG8_9HYPH|nr:sugar ABC transporter substrate-binding protein [Hoeflea prorocentri]MCY6383035.1 sugar ABC transporter substrate-binding protein [Hoeflea prorocentri]MDA5400835.1 sugar ABC transporter substrate-binding protein [Hoeflea prorocentri]